MVSGAGRRRPCEGPDDQRGGEQDGGAGHHRRSPAAADGPGRPRRGARTRTLDVIATNPLARALYSVLYIGPRPAPTSPGSPSSTRARQFWHDWDQVADDLPAHLRAAAGATPYDRALTDLVGELSIRSDTFRQLWARHDVRAYGRGVKHFQQQPVVGALELRYELLRPAAEPGLTMITYTAEPETASHDNLSLLASWAASQHDATEQGQADATSRPITPPSRHDCSLT
ncbi:MmyB family transcriptional regulator [Nonomuraea sp. H19]|uniref:MmyB family transcriptional regulator n=1 Tax=Nonomuraea sp. H19 TaxID=3452206 RepID=UPI003F8B7A46